MDRERRPGPRSGGVCSLAPCCCGLLGSRLALRAACNAQVAGKVQSYTSAGNTLSYATVRAAGHMVGLTLLAASLPVSALICVRFAMSAGAARTWDVVFRSLVAMLSLTALSSVCRTSRSRRWPCSRGTCRMCRCDGACTGQRLHGSCSLLPLCRSQAGRRAERRAHTRLGSSNADFSRITATDSVFE